MILGGGTNCSLAPADVRLAPDISACSIWGQGVMKFSMHWEADFDRGGASVLDIRPLLWKDGWPVAGDNAKEGTYEIESVRTGTALELAVEGVPVGGRRTGRGGAGAGRGGQGAPGGSPQTGAPGGRGGVGGGMFGGQGSPIPTQDVAEVSVNWPAGKLDARMSNYLCQAQQKWAITAVPNAGGYPGSPYFKIAIAGTDRALAATEDAELVVLPGLHRRAPTVVALRPARRRQLAHYAQVGPQF
jgi:arabinan endo-1,5-alpha-L-arabinosidase